MFWADGSIANLLVWERNRFIGKLPRMLWEVMLWGITVSFWNEFQWWEGSENPFWKEGGLLMHKGATSRNSNDGVLWRMWGYFLYALRSTCTFFRQGALCWKSPLWSTSHSASTTRARQRNMFWHQNRNPHGTQRAILCMNRRKISSDCRCPHREFPADIWHGSSRLTRHTHALERNRKLGRAILRSFRRCLWGHTTRRFEITVFFGQISTCGQHTSRQQDQFWHPCVNEWLWLGNEAMWPHPLTRIHVTDRVLTQQWKQDKRLGLQNVRPSLIRKFWTGSWPSQSPPQFTRPVVRLPHSPRDWKSAFRTLQI